MGIKVIFKDDNFVVLDKPAGLLVHSTAYQKKKEPTLADWIVEKFPSARSVGDDPVNRPGIVHRLDRDTSGVMVAALSQEYFEYLKRLFKEKGLRKEYLAIVKGEVKESRGRIDRPIGIKSGTTKRSVHSVKMSKEAITDWERVASFERGGKTFSLLRVFPLTGRTHQIRVHLAFIGHPVIGDQLYGGKENSKLAPRQMLHCAALEFEVSPGNKMRFEAAPPEEFASILGSDILKSNK